MAFIKGSDGIARSLKEIKDITYRYNNSDVATFLPTNVANVGAANVNSGNLISTGQVVSTGNVTGGNIITGAQVVATGDITGAIVIVTAGGFLKNPVYTISTLTAITGQVGWVAVVSDSATTNGMLAFWDTTNSRWSYVLDNSAVV
jgi:hypothetical protein